MSTAKVEKDERAEQQARAQLESIVEMVAGLDRENAARLYVSELKPERVIELLQDEESDENPTINDLREQLTELITQEEIEPDDFEFDEDEARQSIQEDPLSIQVRSGWYTPGSDDRQAEEFEILLCTGGPAVRITGELDGGQPDNARIQYQDWFTPWTEYFIDNDEQREALLAYCREFYFGE